MAEITEKELKDIFENHIRFKKGDIIANFRNWKVFRFENVKMIMDEVLSKTKEIRRVRQWIGHEWYILPEKYVPLFNYFGKPVLRFEDLGIKSRDQIQSFREECREHIRKVNFSERYENTEEKEKAFSIKYEDFVSAWNKSADLFYILLKAYFGA